MCTPNAKRGRLRVAHVERGPDLLPLIIGQQRPRFVNRLHAIAPVSAEFLGKVVACGLLDHKGSRCKCLARVRSESL